LNLTIFLSVCVALGALFEVRALRQFRRRHRLAGTFSVLSGLVLFLIAACAGLLAAGLNGYQRLTLERPIAQLSFKKTGERQFDLSLTQPDGTTANYPMRGDQWQLDARLLKWRAFANLIGFDSVYRLERIGGRYERIEDEQSAPRTVHTLFTESPLDLWDFMRKRQWSWVDAYYGTATYLPMADGARYDVTVTQSGLIARPANEAAQQAVGAWR
jgi:hypothetical protein